MTARSAAPSTPSTGDIYLDDGTNTTSGDPGPRHYNGTGWEDLNTGGAAASETAAGVVQLAADFDTASGEAVQGDDSRLLGGSAAANTAPTDGERGPIRINNGTNVTVTHSFSSGIHTFTINSTVSLSKNGTAVGAGTRTSVSLTTSSFTPIWSFWNGKVSSGVFSWGYCVGTGSTDQGSIVYYGAAGVYNGRVLSDASLGAWSCGTFNSTSVTLSGASTAWTIQTGVAIGA